MPSWLQPMAKPMMLCHDVLPGPGGTENVHLMNVFTSIRPRTDPPYPYRFPQLCVFLQLTDAVGEAFGRIVGRQAASDRIVFFSQPHLIHFAHRLQVKRVVFRLKDRCSFPEPGLYYIQFECDGRWVLDHPLNLLE